MKSTTIRFADPVYQQLELASAATGLPINSIVVVACLEWLEKDQAGRVTGSVTRRWPMPHRHAIEQTVRLQPQAWRWPAPSALVAQDPLYIFTASAQEALAHAHEEAERTRQWIGTEHLLHGLYSAEEGRAGQVLRKLRIDVTGLRSRLREEDGQPRDKARRLLPTSQLRQALKQAREEMTREGAPQLGTDHLLLGLLLDGESQVAAALEAAGVTHSAAREALAGTGPEI
jgi:Clp amino terminal domain, pathogenicity island component